MKPSGTSDQTVYVAVKDPNSELVLLGLNLDAYSAWRVKISNSYPLTEAFGKFSRLKDKLYFGVKTTTTADCYRDSTPHLILISTFSYLGDTTDACLALKESGVETLTGLNS
jgi:hypothetical protein